jgi:hypothetical protein
MSSSTGPHRGHVFLRHLSGLSTFQLSERGSIRQMDLELSPTLNFVLPAYDNEECSWSEEIKELSARATRSQVNASSPQHRPFIQTDLTLVYASELKNSSVKTIPTRWQKSVVNFKEMQVKMANLLTAYLYCGDNQIHNQKISLRRKVPSEY